MATGRWLGVVVLAVVLLAGANSLIHSCKRHKTENSNSTSGVYLMETVTRTRFEVYCEMGLNGGGYTFLSPAALAVMTDKELNELITDKQTLLIRGRKPDGQQPYAVLSQLPEYASIPLKLGLNDHTDYAGPLNKGVLGQHFLYAGFLPIQNAASITIQGFLVNGERAAFLNCDRLPNSQITLFPNFKERDPSTYNIPGRTCNILFANLLPNPSGRLMPVDFFMFGEMHFGGCGCYQQTNQRSDVLALTIGFR